MVRRNEQISKLNTNYLFTEINNRRKQFQAQHPAAKVISLGVGNTTEPLPEPIALGLASAAMALGSVKGYTGYGPEQGSSELREKISHLLYHDQVHADDLFISDGSKCDIGRLQQLFGSKVTIAVQDPSYPVYVDGSVIVGLTGPYDAEIGHYPGIIYMPCVPQNQFFPDLDSLPRTDLIYFCSPNNPTGAAATRQQLEKLVAFAQRNRSIIIYDAAYSDYIQDPDLPRSIYEIEGAHEVAIETNSFSKLAGFTGVRLGWTVVPEQLKFDDGSSVKADWNRLTTTIFNGASNIAQQGGIAVLEKEGLEAAKSVVSYYLENARIIREVLEGLGFQVYGGVNAPYLWVHFPGRNSWDLFQEILEKVQIITSPGIGYGPGGQGFVRFSAFGHRQDVLEAVQRLAGLQLRN